MSSNDLQKLTLKDSKTLLCSNTIEKVEIYNVDGKFFTVKTFNIKRINSDKEKKELLRKLTEEITLMERGLPSIAKVYGSHYDQLEEKFKFSMEFFKCTLESFIENLKKFSKRNRIPCLPVYVSLFLDLVRGSL